MKINEIRTGNYVECDGNIMQIIGINSMNEDGGANDQVLLKGTNKEKSSNRKETLSNCKPVSVSGDKLSQLGFEDLKYNAYAIKLSHNEFIKLIIFKIVVLHVVCLLISVSLLSVKDFNLINKRKPVECGGQTFGSGKNKVEINFFIVALIFIIFEIETIFIIPYLFLIKISF